MHVFFAAYFMASFQVSDFPLILGHKMSLVYPLAAVFRFAILQEGAPKKICYHGFIGTIIKYLRNQKLTQGRQWSIKISRNLSRKKAPTFTRLQTAVLYLDTCTKAITTVVFWRWISACASACPASHFTSRTAWVPWRPLTPTAIH